MVDRVVQTFSFLLILCLGDLFIVYTAFLKSLTIVVLVTISPFSSVSSYFIYLGGLVLGA